MPTYEYECDACHRVFEIRQRISEPALSVCDQCGGSVRRLIGPANFILKGEGWYVTDYPSEARKKAKKAESSGGDAKSSTGASDSSKSSSSTASSSGDSASGGSASGGSASGGSASGGSSSSAGGASGSGASGNGAKSS